MASFYRLSESLGGEIQIAGPYSNVSDSVGLSRSGVWVRWGGGGGGGWKPGICISNEFLGDTAVADLGITTA